MATTASVYNASRTTRQVLKRHRKEGPSLTLHLHANTFRFERQNGAFLCESPLKNLLYFIRDQKVPADLVDIFDEARVPFFEGCLIIEVHDHRPPSSMQSSVFPAPTSAQSRAANGNVSSLNDDDAGPSIFNPDSSARALGGNYGFLRRLGVDARKRNGDQIGLEGAASPSVYRVVLYPSAETLWTDMRLLNESEGAGLWQDEDVLEIESRILALTSPPLCLTPDLQVSRLANVMLSATALPCAYSPSSTSALPYFRQSDRKRGINSIEVELDESNKKRREKIMRMMEKGSSSKAKETIVGSSTHAPSFARMAFVERWRQAKAANETSTTKLSDNVGDGTVTSNADEKSTTSKKKSKKKKAVAEEEEVKEQSPPAAPAKKKTKKKAQREKEERERAEREQAEKEAAAARAREEEAAAAASKKGKKGKKKDKENVAQQKQQQVEAQVQASAEPVDADGSKKGSKQASKSKKQKVNPSPSITNASLSTDTQPQANSLGTPQQSPANVSMYQQQMGYPVLTQQQQGQQSLQGGGNLVHNMSPSPFPGQFGGTSNNTGGITLPGQLGNFANASPQQQHQLLHQAGLQRAMQQSGLNANFMMNNPQMQQQLQAFAALQQQQQQQQTMSTGSPHQMASSQSQQSQTPFNTQDSLPVGVGLGNLPPNWNGRG